MYRGSGMRAARAELGTQNKDRERACAAFGGLILVSERCRMDCPYTRVEGLQEVQIPIP